MGNGSVDFQPRPLISGKSVPVLFLTGVALLLTGTYLFLHCRSLLQIDLPPGKRDPDLLLRGQVHAVLFITFATLWTASYIRCITELPGTIPSTPDWNYDPNSDTPAAANNLNIEKKRSGERRHCKWCSKYKPDRAHHCRMCRVCILKMDHHCPWIYNCVGYRNHKFFFLLLVYSVLITHMVIWTMFESVRSSIKYDTHVVEMFLVLFAWTVALSLGVIVTLFFVFHVWLMCKALTTIEYCEKSGKKAARGEGLVSGYKKSSWIGDVQEVLGRDPLVWLLPIQDLPDGGGLTFVSETTMLTTDLGVGRAYASKHHRTGKRSAANAPVRLGEGSRSPHDDRARSPRGAPSSAA